MPNDSECTFTWLWTFYYDKIAALPVNHRAKHHTKLRIPIWVGSAIGFFFFPIIWVLFTVLSVRADYKVDLVSSERSSILK